MDAITLTRRNSKKIKVEGEDLDRISSLPDNIIQDILSFLPTKKAVSTSALSTRWKYLWTGISSLDFVYKLEWCVDKNDFVNKNDKTQIFMDFVAKVLNLIDATVLNKFYLNCASPLDMPRVNAWISIVVGRKVRELILELQNVGCPIIVPVLHLNCECLKIKCETYFKYVLVCLSLSRTLFYCELLKNSCLEFIPKDHVPISLSNLKVLNLSNTEISFDQDIQQVSFSFPSLEEADLDNCIWVNVKTISFFVPRLKRLTLVNDDEDRDDEYEDFCKIKVYAESLVFLKISVIISMEVSLYDVCSLNQASIHTWNNNEHTWNIDDYTEPCLSRILGAVTNVRDLTLSDVTIHAIHSVNLTMNLLKFSNLKTLRIDVDLAVQILEGVILTEFFRYLPNIESLMFRGGLNDRFYHIDEPNYGWKIERTPQPILLNLKLVEITNSDGHENELSMVEYLLLNARALEMISITMYSRSDRKKGLELLNKLQLHLMEQEQDFTFSSMLVLYLYYGLARYKGSLLWGDESICHLIEPEVEISLMVVMANFSLQLGRLEMKF